MAFTTSLTCAGVPAVSLVSSRPTYQARGARATRPACGSFLRVPGPGSHTASIRRFPSTVRAEPESEPGKNIEEKVKDVKGAASDIMKDAKDVGRAAVSSASGAVENAAAADAGPNRGSLVYGALAVLFGLFGLAKVALPATMIEGVFSACGNGMTEAFMRLSGVFMALPAAALWCLKGAAEHGRLGSATYGRLNGSLMVYGLGYAAVAAVAALNTSLTTAWGIWVPVGTGLITAVTAAHVLAKGDGGILGPITGIPSAVAEIFKFSSPLSTAYGLLAVVCGLMGAALLGIPSSLHGYLFTEAVELAEVAGPGLVPIVQKRMIGVGLLTMTTTTALILKDATERSRLGASTFKLLNLAFAVTCLGTLAVMGWYVKSSATAQITAASGVMFAVCALTGGMCAYQYATASK